VPSTGLEPAVATSGLPRALVLGRAVTVIGSVYLEIKLYRFRVFSPALWKKMSLLLPRNVGIQIPTYANNQ